MTIEGTGVQMASGRGVGSAPAMFWGICPVLAVWSTPPSAPRRWVSHRMGSPEQPSAGWAEPQTA